MRNKPEFSKLKIIVIALVIYAITIGICVAAVSGWFNPKPKPAAKVIQSKTGLMTEADAARWDAEIEDIDRKAGGLCGIQIATKMAETSPQSGSFTLSPRLLLHEPKMHSIGWAIHVNYNFEVIDAVLSRCTH